MPHPSLPSKPTPTASASASASAVISAEPELRDFKKEATAFVPSALKRRKLAAAPGAGGLSSSKINAAPSLGPSADSGEKGTGEDRGGGGGSERGPDLMSALRDQLGVAVVPPSDAGRGATGKKDGRVKPKDDYEKFMDEMGDILGPSSAS